MISGLWNTGVLKVLFSFYRKAVKERSSEILFTQETLISVVVGGTIGLFGNRLFPGSAKLLDIAVGFLGYAAIALGFCVGGMTIALTFPDREFMTDLATLTIPERRGNALENLLFVFSWTAVVHWSALAFLLVAILLHGHQDNQLLTTQSVISRLWISFIVFICCYALLQFVITVLTLWQVGGAYIGRLRGNATKKDA
ncbi:hypothetical protein [Terriglobus roseus]|uniref:Uncharacterized protein n=1 Tax=Terriglobus roseus TaxID=392734 RepID=A0A1H4QQK0_9BACT|nr:hypothetical protein [Terriglobus roseus]SEC21774.1 hypothetical protein SAMN05443244_2934 [Terriglobus roseus]